MADNRIMLDNLFLDFGGICNEARRSLPMDYRPAEWYGMYHEWNRPERIWIVYKGFLVEIFRIESKSYANFFDKLLHRNPIVDYDYKVACDRNGIEVKNPLDKTVIMRKAIANIYKLRKEFLADFECAVREVVDNEDSESV